jgi:hypothetical protein
MRLVLPSWLPLVANQAGWFACVLGAAHGVAWVGPVVVAAWCSLYVAAADSPRREAALVVATAAWGYLVDAALVLGGVFAFTPPARLGWPSSPWMIALWALFGTTLRGPLARLLARPGWAALAGALAGPLAYGGGVRLGAAAFGSDPLASRVAIGAAWALTLPLLGLLERKTRPRATTLLA